jgi:hypothetical protein
MSSQQIRYIVLDPDREVDLLTKYSPSSLTSDAVFKEAAASFQAGLSEPAKALFTPVNTIEDLQTFLDQYTQKKGDVWEQTWLVRGCEAIQTFSRIMKPYFDVVDTLVSSHPEYAAFVWGGLKLVVQVRIP